MMSTKQALSSTSTHAEPSQHAASGASGRLADADSPRQLAQEAQIAQLQQAESDVDAPAQKPAQGGLPEGMRSGIEALSGMDMSGVRVHRNSGKPAQLNAHAYAQGNDIHLGPGQEKHLPHEAWHVVQQAQGRVRPTIQMAGRVRVNDEVGLEREADLMGAQAAMQGAVQLRVGQRQSLPLSSLPMFWPAAPLQMKYELCDEADVTWASDHRAKSVYAKNIKGETLDTAANSPSVSPFGWNELKNEGHTLANASGKNSHYNAVRAHLMNGRLGGPGDDVRNLAPATAQINSQMSAGPETAAKSLVDAGHTIWLRTTLTYHSASTIATDFTAAVPNNITMEWGVVGRSDVSRWESPIQLPVAPLQGTEALEYKNWDENKDADLVLKLGTQSNQVRAQAFDLVSHGKLKLAILKSYPQVYLSMERVAKGQILADLGETVSLELLTHLGMLTSPDELVEQAILPLAAAGQATRAQKLFHTLGRGQQRAALISWKDELLKHLGEIGDAWSKLDYTIFNYNEDNSKAYLLDSMAKRTLNAFLSQRSKRQRINLLHLWVSYICKAAGTVEKTKAIARDKKIAPVYKREFAKEMGFHSRAEEYKSSRPSRSGVAKKKYR
jgi:hypothetical protein